MSKKSNNIKQEIRDLFKKLGEIYEDRTIQISAKFDSKDIVKAIEKTYLDTESEWDENIDGGSVSDFTITICFVK